jgi:hypothetical protein
MPYAPTSHSPVNTFFLPQSIDAALGDAADQLAIALAVERIG